MHRYKWGAHCVPIFKLWQVGKVQVSVLALLPGAPVPHGAQRGLPPPPPPRVLAAPDVGNT